jgi:hypothetical protein
LEDLRDPRLAQSGVGGKQSYSLYGVLLGSAVFLLLRNSAFLGSSNAAPYLGAAGQCNVLGAAGQRLI